MELIYTEPALDDLARLPVQMRDRVFKKISFYATQDDPLHFAEHLTGFRAYRFRIGMYRVFFEIQSDTLFVLAIRKRDKAYRGLE